MRTLALVLAMLMTGCVTAPPRVEPPPSTWRDPATTPVTSGRPAPTTSVVVVYPVSATAQRPARPQRPVAAALAFSPAAAPAPVDLWRDDRLAGAFWGFQQQVTTFYHLHIDDRFSSEPYNNRYERRAIVNQSGVSYR